MAGPVRLMEYKRENPVENSSFNIISSTVVASKSGSKRSVNSKFVTSGHAPVYPGSKAGIASHLDPTNMNLLVESFKGAKSDVSVSLEAYYEAWVPTYKATVTAEMEQVYKHVSTVWNQQKGYTRNHFRDIVDELQRNQVLNIEELDRSGSLEGVNNDRLSGILNIVTNKLTEVMFDTKTGWATEPTREVAITQGQIKGRRKRGFLARVFGGAKNLKYYSDDQLVLKNEKISRHSVSF